MSKIISPVPVEIGIRYNEMTGQIEYRISKELPYPQIVVIFSTLMTQMALSLKPMTAAPPVPPQGGNNGQTS